MNAPENDDASASPQPQHHADIMGRPTFGTFLGESDIYPNAEGGGAVASDRSSVSFLFGVEVPLHHPTHGMHRPLFCERSRSLPALGALAIFAAVRSRRSGIRGHQKRSRTCVAQKTAGTVARGGAAAVGGLGPRGGRAPQGGGGAHPQV